MEREAKRPGETPHDRAIRHWKLAFVKADEFLDGTREGPLHLSDPACAQIVEDSILRGSNEEFLLWAWCVMPNHVHVLLTPKSELAAITQRLKGSTAREVNKRQNQLGRTFWQGESYDHWARDEEEMLRIIHYVEDNPVKARLCKRADDWRWSSARFRSHWRPGTPYVG